MTLPQVHDVEPGEVQMGAFDVKTSGLADIVGVSGSTIHKWVKDSLISPYREDSFSPGRPAMVFDLRSVMDDMEHLTDWVQATERYVPALEDEIMLRGEQRINPFVDGDIEDEDEHEANLLAQRGEPLPEALVETLRERLHEVRVELTLTGDVLAKVLMEPEPMFTMNEAMAMHNAVRCRSERLGL